MAKQRHHDVAMVPRRKRSSSSPTAPSRGRLHSDKGFIQDEFLMGIDILAF
jgi:hypothetical protein